MTYAVIRIRGVMNRNQEINDTLSMLNLKRINHCVLLPETPSYKGMLNKVVNWVTWGEVSEEMEKKLKAKIVNKIARLSPPSHGYESTKLHFPKGSAGYRGKEINELLKRMV